MNDLNSLYSKSQKTAWENVSEIKRKKESYEEFHYNNEVWLLLQDMITLEVRINLCIHR